jgi:hypothetical protein
VVDRSERYRAISALRPPLDDVVLAELADALEDHELIMVGTPGWEEDRDNIGWAARRVLETAGPRVEHFVAPKLASTDREVIEHALAILAKRPVLEPATIDAMLRHAADPTLAYHVGNALRGKLDARPLLDYPETRLAGFLATPDLQPSWLLQLLDDPTLRWRVLDRIADIDPPPHELAPAIVPLLADDDARCHAIGALARLCPDDASITAVMIDASAIERRDASFALAKRPVAHLRTHVPALLAQLQSGRTDIARVLAKLGDIAPPEVAVALGHELTVGRGYVVLVDALGALGNAALPALPAVIAAAQDLGDEYAREAAGQLAVKLRHHQNR